MTEITDADRVEALWQMLQEKEEQIRQMGWRIYELKTLALELGGHPGDCLGEMTVDRHHAIEYALDVAGQALHPDASPEARANAVTLITDARRTP